jgi:hypothetical protein
MTGTSLAFLLIAWGIIMGAVVITLSSLLKHEKGKS